MQRMAVWTGARFQREPQEAFNRRRCTLMKASTERKELPPLSHLDLPRCGRGCQPAHPKDRSTALCHAAVSAARRSSGIDGVQQRVTAQLARRSSKSCQ